MQTVVAPPISAPFLRLYQEQELDIQVPVTTNSHTPRFTSAMTLSEFFQEWYKPIVLDAENRTEDTIVSYNESLGYWSLLTGNPPLSLIDEFTIRDFSEGLKTHTYKRSSRKGAKSYAFSASTIAKHLRQVRAVLNRAGPTLDPNKPGKNLLQSVPHIRVTKPDQAPKEPIELQQARQILAATQLLKGTRKLSASQLQNWSKALLKTLFYTGLRIGTVLRLTESMIVEDGTMLHVPGNIVKNGKEIKKPLHPEVLRAIQKVSGSKYLLEWPHHRRHLRELHKKLQAHACIDSKQHYSLHAWRRTHAVEMARLGARHAMKAAQLALSHSDERTTSQHYVDMATIEKELIAQLPLLETVTEDKQLLLF